MSKHLEYINSKLGEARTALRLAEDAVKAATERLVELEAESANPEGEAADD